jgi:hypothetical protein
VRAAVYKAWRAYNKDLEGILNFPYADVKNLITTAMGCKIDPVEDALKLPWCLIPSWRRATNDEVLKAWHAVKNDPRSASEGWTHAIKIPENNIRLHDEHVDALIDARLDGFNTQLAKKFPAFEEWPADAQLAVLSMVWALGFEGLVSKFPKCCRALAAEDFKGAAAECKMTPEAGSLIKRNALNKELLLNAEACIEDSGDPEVLVWQP